MPLKPSWVESANRAGCPFPLNNLPCGTFTADCGDKHNGVAIGDRILDVTALEQQGVISFKGGPLLDQAGWNKLMAAGPEIWASLRDQITRLLEEGAPQRTRVEAFLVPLLGAELHLPFRVAEYTDFYAGRHHAFNVGSMFRDPENALPPNWLHIPIGYNGRASSVVVSGTNVRRPWGQLKGSADDKPVFAPSQRFDIELEIGAVIGLPSKSGQPVTVAEADAMIFGYVLLNDWSARDIQAWEYQPLGPFQSKATATTISPWIVMKAALEPFRVATTAREIPLLPHLVEPGPLLYDIDLEVSISPDAKSETTVSRTNYREMYYSAAQQLAHHTTSGCPMNTGDLLGSGTISGPLKENRGSLLELSWGGKEPLTLDGGETRSFLHDNDAITLRGAAKGDGYIIGFGDCTGRILPALAEPYLRQG
ncbi:fumarylacetoacetase [Rhizobium hidalgonense]|uniref:fumarylacetoacetase n=1 Tax=Rhizobium hidalgonense TaxID=1538159 RepID=UPI00110580E2|nr:fumarylacetoacetase [Rhizobium hidalgonense]QKK27007.1 fumarylacetoacetase [Rhizobium hidalgonense]